MTRKPVAIVWVRTTTLSWSIRPQLNTSPPHGSQSVMRGNPGPMVEMDDCKCLLHHKHDNALLLVQRKIALRT